MQGPALRAAFSAASWAANGVPLRDPLKPTLPALAHEIRSPRVSVMETRVLLKVLWMWTIPCAMFFFSFGFCRVFAFFCAMRSVFSPIGPSQ